MGKKKKLTKKQQVLMNVLERAMNAPLGKSSPDNISASAKNDFNMSASDSQPSANVHIPSVPYEIEKGKFVTMDILSRSIHDRVITLNGEVNNMSAEVTIKLLKHMANESDEPIELMINSPGGSVIDGMAIYDTIMSIKAPVYTTVTGMAASMGSLLSSVGEPGHRRALANSRIMIHQPLIGGANRSQETEVEALYESLKKTRDELTQVYVEHSGNPHEMFDLLLERDLWLTPDEAVTLGLLDKVVQPIKNAPHAGMKRTVDRKSISKAMVDEALDMLVKHKSANDNTTAKNTPASKKTGNKR